MNEQLMHQALINMLTSTLASESFVQRADTLIAEHIEAAICRQLPKQLSAEYLSDLALTRLNEALSSEAIEKQATDRINDIVEHLDLEYITQNAIEEHTPDINDLAEAYINDNLPDMDDMIDEALRDQLPHREFEERASRFVNDHLEDFTVEMLDFTMRDLDIKGMVLDQLKLNGIEEMIQQAIRTVMARVAITVKDE